MTPIEILSKGSGVSGTYYKFLFYGGLEQPDRVSEGSEAPNGSY